MLHVGDYLRETATGAAYEIHTVTNNAVYVHCGDNAAITALVLLDHETDLPRQGERFEFHGCPHTAPAPATVTPDQDRIEAYAYNCGAMEACLFDLWRELAILQGMAIATNRQNAEAALAPLVSRIESMATHLRPMPNPDRVDDVNWLFAQLYLGRK